MSGKKCKAVKRKAQKPCFCRGCSLKLEKGDELIYFYSTFGQGQHIYLCLECCNIIGLIANVEIEKENEEVTVSNGNPCVEIIAGYYGTK